MDIRPIMPGFAVAPQIAPQDVTEIAALGFRTLICNRPDDEADGQPPVAGIAARARAAGLAFHNLPFSPGNVTADLVEALRDLLSHSETPVLAYCRSGTRSAALWSLAQAQTYTPTTLLQMTAGAGYDLSDLRLHLEALHRAASRTDTTKA
ncbi:sulfide:quinone oxidoreductase [Rhodovulum imhoffii]|uniref:Sulfide:quinone oxidoreductase n=1 Tax=Rhodovulum imhoffii TaxID=365340 RepID=A0A2T5BPR0_9RHOB|nr:TIGR01244 family sulfur transferase [Rhodovulum imhoffii]MBK5933084.1 TIGR01244 family protein [Rhodovulum imhoffii]PTN01060.1 sulfide:quinone oxidoreductase [Rhodovulum imhoffii]